VADNQKTQKNTGTNENYAQGKELIMLAWFSVTVISKDAVFLPIFDSVVGQKSLTNKSAISHWYSSPTNEMVPNTT
jgi:hypothetical protein